MPTLFPAQSCVPPPFAMASPAPWQPPALTAFWMLAFGLSWACWWMSPYVALHSPWLGTLLMWAGGFGPSAAAVLVVWRWRGRAGLRNWLVGCVRPVAGWGWLLLAFTLPLVVVLIAAGVHTAMGGTMAPSPATGHLLLASVNLLAIALLGGPLGEEFGWRGLALPALQARLGWRYAGLLLGLVWGVWHLPLFYQAHTLQSHTTMPAFLLSTLAMSVMVAWLALRSGGGVTAALVLHTATNFWPTIVPVLPTADTQRPFELVVALQVLLALGFLAFPGVPELKVKTKIPDSA